MSNQSTLTNQTAFTKITAKTSAITSAITSVSATPRHIAWLVAIWLALCGMVTLVQAGAMTSSNLNVPNASTDPNQP
ncbi:MAG: hypothetical protein U1C59_08850, partial [Methylotenera sp.]|nr:hypothetical protein [Methylotenera sp.]